LSVGSLIRSSYLRYFSKPAEERAIYQAIHRRPIRSIVEIGLNLAARTPRLIEMAAARSNSGLIRYTAIDQFEARPAGHPQLSLKQAFATLRGAPAQVRLIPGDPAGALARTANSLTGTDLLLISSLPNDDSLAQAWIWIPRMLTASSLVLLQQPGGKSTKTTWQSIPQTEIHRLATAASKSRRQAA
jgi:hypothetical protein